MVTEFFIKSPVPGIDGLVGGLTKQIGNSEGDREHSQVPREHY